MSSGILTRFDLPSTKRNEDMYDVFRYSHSIRLPYNMRNEDMYDLFRYSHFDSITFRKRETKTCMMSSGILTQFDLPSTKRNEDMYDVFKYSHSIRFTFDKEERRHVWCLQVFSFDSMTLQHEKRRHVWCLQVFSLRFDYLSTKRNEDMYDVFRYSHSIRFTFDKEERRHVWCPQVFSLDSIYLRQRGTKTCMMSSGTLTWFDIPSIKRNEDMYDVFRYSHSIRLPYNMRKEDMYDVFRYSHFDSITFRQRETKTEIYYVIFRYSRIRGLKILLSYAT